MRNLFDVRPAKVELRRQFEKREWKSDETFGTYFYDKVILAGRVPVNEDELVDYLIDGIPDRFLQNQARMQRFVRKDMLLRAFENIKLRPENKGKHGRDSNVVASDKSKQGKPGVPQKNENKAEGTRCYNCNQTGHRMKECTKPKRDQGSCYECGVQGHGMRDCPQRQKKTTPTTEPEPKQSTPYGQPDVRIIEGESSTQVKTENRILQNHLAKSVVSSPTSIIIDEKYYFYTV
ncbi:uncharacterized protein [Temnothorax nylanderi]|uniref:uncharacterized protein isoform X2 n=1 Tax=Temnothorax nylanderi TaxID=102681 RepID=UPI003A8BCCA6